jgi:hypothetical protein
MTPAFVESLVCLLACLSLSRPLRRAFATATARMSPSTDGAPPRSWSTPPHLGVASSSPHGRRVRSVPRSGSAACQEPPVSIFVAAGRRTQHATALRSCGCGQSARVGREGHQPRATHDAIPVLEVGPKRVVGAQNGLGGRPPRRPPVCPISAITLAVPWSHPKASPTLQEL